MFSLDFSCILKWKTDKRYWLPASVETICPFCEKGIIFRLEKFKHIKVNLDIVGCTAECPHCNQVAFFWIIDPKTKDGPQDYCAALLIYPVSKIPAAGQNKSLPISSVSNSRWKD